MYETSLASLPHHSQQIAMHRKIEETAIKHVDFPEAYYQAHSDKITRVVENARDKKKSRLPPRTIFKREDG